VTRLAVDLVVNAGAIVGVAVDKELPVGGVGAESCQVGGSVDLLSRVL
jgi:hypothetical protein